MERENDQDEQLDMISNVPDHIIANIISFLPTDEAIRTSILSLRWKYLWKDIHSISLKGEIGLTRMNAWVSAALSCKIEKLFLYFQKWIPDLPAPPLPECILHCSTLVALKLDSCFDIRIPESIVCFPHIKSLGFNVILPNQDKVMHQLLSSCPILEELSLTGLLDFGKVRKIDICIPTLKKLSLFLEYKRGGEYDITIDTPNLQYLEIEDNSTSRFVVKNLSQVHHVDITYEGLLPKPKKNLLELLNGIAATDLMILNYPTTVVLGSALSYTWPIFFNLTMLKMCLTDESFGWTCFPRVLHSAPKLKVLVLDLGRMNIDLEGRKPCVWIPPDEVPLCLLDNLRIIGVKWLVGKDDEVQAVEYLLKNARVLEQMMIDSRGLDEEVMEKFLMCPTASGTCDIQFYE